MGKRRRCGAAIFEGERGPNVRLSRAADWADEKNMTERMRWIKKIREGILMGQNRKKEIKKGKIFGPLKIRNLIQINFDLKILQNICK
jgi:hypothetical protein